MQHVNASRDYRHDGLGSPCRRHSGRLKGPSVGYTGTASDSDGRPSHDAKRIGFSRIRAARLGSAPNKGRGSDVFGRSVRLISPMELSPYSALRGIGLCYTTVLPSVPEVLVVYYLFYFGGSLVLTKVMNAAGLMGFYSLPSFATGVMVGIVSGVYQTEAYRAAFLRLDRGRREAGLTCGMSNMFLLRRIIAPQTLRFALPALGNIWQSALKETSLLSVIGLTELLRQVGRPGSTHQPLLFDAAAAVIFLVIGRSTGLFFRTQAFEKVDAKLAGADNSRILMATIWLRDVSQSD